MIDETATAEPTENVTESNEAPSFGEASDDAIDTALSAAYDKAMSDSEDGAPAEAATPNETMPEGVETDDQPKGEGDETTEPGHAQESIDPPNSWSDSDKAKWAAVPREVQEVVAQRERDAHEQITKQGEYLSAFKPLAEAFQRYPQYANRNPGEFMGNLLHASDFLDRDPVAALKWLAGNYGVDTRNLIEGDQQSNDLDDLFRDPRVDQVQQQLTTTQQQLNAALQQIQQLTGHTQQQQQAAYQQTLSKIESEIDAFKGDQPYFDELFPEIEVEARFLRSIDKKSSPVEILKKAYSRALNNNETVRAKIEQERKQKDEAEAAKRAGKAKANASTNVKSRTTSTVRDTSWEDDDYLGAIYDRAMAGG
jgi:TolA-binding protein